MRRPIQCLQRSSARITGALALILALSSLASTVARAQYAPISSHEQVDLGKLVCKDAHFPKEEVVSGGEGWVEFRVKVQPDGTMAEQAANRVSELNDIILVRSALMGLQGRYDIALRYLQQIPLAEKDMGDEERARLLRMRLGLELKLGLLASADLSGRKLAKATPQADDAVMLASLEKLRQLGASGQPMAVKGRVPAECRLMICDPTRPTWEYVPTHRTISLLDPAGRLDTVTFRCTAKTFATQATIGTIWTIPASFGTCAVEVTGEPGASFTVIDETAAG